MSADLDSDKKYAAALTL